jgi:hypothetical protein
MAVIGPCWLDRALLARGLVFVRTNIMNDPQEFASKVSGSIQAAKSAASVPAFAQPEYWKTVLRGLFDQIPDAWRCKAKSHYLLRSEASLDDLTARLNEDIHASTGQSDRYTIYQLLLRLTIVIYGIESDLLRSTSSGGPLF